MVAPNVIGVRRVAIKALVVALGGDARNDMCCCPAHSDSNPSLWIYEYGGRVGFYCHAGCTREAIEEALRVRGLWPLDGNCTGPAVTPRRRRTSEERREFALRILSDTRANRGCELRGELAPYFAGRCITSVPATAMLGLPFNTDPHLGDRLIGDDPSLVFEITDGQRIIGAHVTWLTSNLTAKRDEEPQRQTFGPISGGYIKLYDGQLDPKGKLIISEGIETALSASQLAGGLPAIAALSANNLPKITPPVAAEYVIASDNDKPGIAGANALAVKLKHAGFRVFITTPKVPGEDWNDVLQKG